MKPVSVVEGQMVPLPHANIDTDQIIPKQFLKRIEKTGYGQFLFFDWRLNEDGSPNPDFELNAPQFKGASILLTRDNFGCGSSREHAPWALLDYGFHSILAPSFADIFYNNCFKNGMLPVQLPQDQISDLFEWVGANPGAQLTVDLESQTLSGDSLEYPFEVDPFRRDCLLKGLNDIDLTLQYEEQIREYESKNG